MNWFSKEFGVHGTKPACPNTIRIGKIRANVITEQLIRIEFQKTGKYCDLPTQSILCRDLGAVDFAFNVKNGMLCIKTAKVRLIISLLTGKALSATLADGRKVTDFHSGNLRGTVRTLDKTHGPTELGEGVVSLNGASVLDDSNSLVLCPCGKVLPRDEILLRDENGSDNYYFLYGYNYIDAVKDFYSITGATPLIPRYTLGNWWSRYKEYTQDEYLTLMHRFTDEGIPITVATVDMDWHWVDVVNKFGKEAKNKIPVKNKSELLYNYVISQGWTGYSWNTDLFPDYRKFLNELNSLGYKVTLNLHPACGVRFFEDMYDEFADFMGVDKSKKEQIAFDITNPKFIEGYFKFIHHKYEDEGVAFWWLDWQQGNNSYVDGLDPLWALNHYHLLDNGRDNRRGLILSRFAGAGSHRYPLGFSGDTAMCWDSLAFQPYFTATASNIGYSWWSHDIGGHMNGYKDDELYIRWVQFGLFSPIMRLHSSNNEFMGKEPWYYSAQANKSATDALRMRHRLIPYLYTMNYRTASEGRALIEPLYYHYPKMNGAYEAKNEYFFGSEIIAVPITEPADENTLLAGVDAWIPKGRYTDIFNGRIYTGPQSLRLYRDCSSIPVLAKAGAIIPMSVNDSTNDCTNPVDMELLIYRGNNSFTLYEDDGISMDYKNGSFCKTKFDISENENNIHFTINSPIGDSTLIPKKRNWVLSFKDITGSEKISVLKNSKEVKAEIAHKGGSITVKISGTAKDKIEIILENTTHLENPSRKEMLTELISKFQDKNLKKMLTYYPLLKKGKHIELTPKWSRGPITEILRITESDE